MPRGKLLVEHDSSSYDFLRRQIESGSYGAQERQRAALTIGYYLRAPWTDNELIEMALSKFSKGPDRSPRLEAWLRRFLSSFDPDTVARVREYVMDSHSDREIAKFDA